MQCSREKFKKLRSFDEQKILRIMFKKIFNMGKRKKKNEVKEEIKTNPSEEITLPEANEYPEVNENEEVSNKEEPKEYLFTEEPKEPISEKSLGFINNIKKSTPELPETPEEVIEERTEEEIAAEKKAKFLEENPHITLYDKPRVTKIKNLRSLK